MAAIVAILGIGWAMVAVSDEGDVAAVDPWPENMDAVAAAPESHRVLLENDRVRVLEVVIAPGEKEPVHTHRWPSVMMVDRAARIRYYGADGSVVFESPADAAGDAALRSPPSTRWLGPEGLHAVENIDTVPFHAIRVELKDP